MIFPTSAGYAIPWRVVTMGHPPVELEAPPASPEDNEDNGRAAACSRQGIKCRES